MASQEMALKTHIGETGLPAGLQAKVATVRSGMLAHGLGSGTVLHQGAENQTQRALPFVW